jgi:hypothetical protein
MDELTNDWYLVDTGATCCTVPCTSNAGPSGTLLKGADGQPIPRGCQAWQPMMPQQTARLLAATHPGSPAATKLVSFSDLLVSSPLQQEQPRIRLGTVFLLPAGRFLHAPGQQLLRSLNKGGICSASRNHLQGSTSDIVHSSPEASAPGEPCGGCLCLWFVARSSMAYFVLQ